MLVIIVGLMVLLAGCITPHQEMNGKWTKPAKVEERSGFGTNHGFARLERCDGPAKKKAWYQFYYESDFTNCIYLTKAEQDEWEGDQSRGAGPDLLAALFIGPPIGIGQAKSGSRVAAGATAMAVSNPIVNIRKRY